jgi:hypothetical protein
MKPEQHELNGETAAGNAALCSVGWAAAFLSMTRILQIMVSLALLGVMAFCVYGFLASFELGMLNVWHGIYGVAGVSSLVVAMRLLPGQNSAFKGFRWVGRTALATLLFLGLVLVLWVWATGGGHAPWPPR